MPFDAFPEFFAVRMMFAALIANALAALCVLAVAGLAVIPFNAFAIFFAVAVAFMAFVANALATVGVLAFAVTRLAALSLHALAVFFAVAMTFTALVTNVLAVLPTVFPIAVLDFRDCAVDAWSNRRRLERRSRRRNQCQCRQRKGDTKTH